MTTYKVVNGDTGDKIAQKFGITFAQLSSANPGVEWTDLQIGQTLNIPASDSNGGGSGGSPGGSDPGTNGDTTVRHYSGPASNFPDSSKWQKFSLMWNHAAKAMKQYDTDQQISYISQAINTVAAEAKPQIDKRVILCVIMQESDGNVHVETTVDQDGEKNPGLMQSENGATFDKNNQQGSILQMIRDGTEGTKTGFGLTQWLKQYGNVYEMLRAYNSGQVDKNQLDKGFGATDSYVSDIANRLMGATPN